MISVKKVLSLLEEYLDKNGWAVVEKHRTDELSLLTQYWVVDSVWSPTDTRFFVGVESYDETFDRICLSLTEPQFREASSWLVGIYLAKGWEVDYEEFLTKIEGLRYRSKVDPVIEQESIGDSGEP